jgi:hypothetical protein
LKIKKPPIHAVVVEIQKVVFCYLNELKRTPFISLAYCQYKAHAYVGAFNNVVKSVTHCGQIIPIHALKVKKFTHPGNRDWFLASPKIRVPDFKNRL